MVRPVHSLYTPIPTHPPQLILTDMLSINSSSSPVLTHDRNTVPMPLVGGRGKVLHEYSTGR